MYGTILARTGTAPGSGHGVEVTAEVPGGDAGTGGSSTGTFSGVGGTLTCTDCHSPHGSGIVAAFRGDRVRVRSDTLNSPTSAKLLKVEPTGASAPVGTYGSDWCLACHAGRASGGVVHNHPVESGDPAWNYGNVAILSGDDPTGATVLGGMAGSVYVLGHTDSAPDGGWNRGYLMPYPRTTEQVGRAPICQQCHEDSRSVGELVANGTQGDAEAVSIAAADGLYWNGSVWTTSTADNPAFQNFPHETQNAYMLVETQDDLCLNCHPVEQLP